MNYSYITKEVEKRLLINNLPQEVKEHVVAGLTENIFKRTLIAIAETLTDEEAATFSEKMELGEIEYVLSTITEKHPEFNAIIKRIIEEVLGEFLLAMKN